MLQFRSTDKKPYRHLSDSKNENNMNQSLDFLDNSVMRVVERERNQNASINSQLHTNYAQIKQLLKDRKVLLRNKNQNLFQRNKDKIGAIAQARQQDLKNEARMLNDPTLLNLIEKNEALSKSKQLLTRVADIKDIHSYAMSQITNGKKFWDSHKNFQREKKNKIQQYTTASKQMKDLTMRERNIFSEIQRCQNQIVNLLFKNRDDPDHMRKAERLNEEIQKRKNLLKEIKNQKSKIKTVIIEIIDDLLRFSKDNEEVFKKKIKQIDEIFAGSQSIAQFDVVLNAIENILSKKSEQNQKTQSMPNSIQNFNEIFRSYDIIVQEIEKLKQEQDQTFAQINDELKQNIRGAIMQKIFMNGVSFKQDPNQVWRKCTEYRKILSDLNQDRPRLQTQIQKISSMSSALVPIKRTLSTEEIRREELKSELKKLCKMNELLEEKEKQQKNFQFTMEELVHRRRVVEAEINQSAQKINLAEYKSKMRELQELDRRIGGKNDAVLTTDIYALRNQIDEHYQRIWDQYQDLIQQVEISEQQPTRGVFLSKLEKRLSLI